MLKHYTSQQQQVRTLILPPLLSLPCWLLSPSVTESRNQWVGAIMNNVWPHQRLQNLGGINQNHAVYYNGTDKRICDVFPSLSDTFSHRKDKSGYGDKAMWWRGTSLRVRPLAGRPLEQLTVTTTAYYIWAANHSENEQKHSRSGRMKRCTLSPFQFFPRKRSMWCEHVRIKDVGS